MSIANIKSKLTKLDIIYLDKVMHYVVHVHSFFGVPGLSSLVLKLQYNNIDILSSVHMFVL